MNDPRAVIVNINVFVIIKIDIIILIVVNNTGYQLISVIIVFHLIVIGGVTIIKRR